LSVKDTKLENSRIELEIEVPVERVEIEYKAVFDKITKTAKVDGFRKGKAPVELVERKYAEYADQEVIENLMKSALIDAINEKQLNPITEPTYDFESITRGEAFSFKAIIEVYPTVELGKYKEVAADEKVCQVTDKDIEGEVDSIRERFAEVEKREEEAKVENGNLAKIKVKRLDVDEESEEAAFRDYSIVVGKATDESALDKKIVGMKAGEEKNVEVKYPKDYYIKDLAGQKVKYQVKVEELSSMTLPEVNDDLAVQAQYESVDDMKAKIQEYLDNYIVNRTRGEAKAKLIQTIVEDSTFDLPESMIRAEMGAIFKKTKDRISQQYGLPAEALAEYPMAEFAEMMDMSAEDFEAKIKIEAENSVKTTLVLSEVMRNEELTVSEEQFDAFVDKYAKSSGKAAEEIKEIIQQNNSRENIEQELLLENAMDFIYDNAKVKKLKPVALEALMREQ